MIKAVSAGRAGIIGNPTDGYGGTMIACSIKQKAVTTIEESNVLTIENEYGKSELKWKSDFSSKGDYFDIVRSILRYYKLYDLKVKIKTFSDIPLQAGLAGSTAILSSILGAISTYIGKDYNKYLMAEINRTIELHYMKTYCGYQDAYMTTFGGLSYLDFRGKEKFRSYEDEIFATVENISEYVEELPFVIAHTGIKHHSGNFHRPLRDRWLEGERKVVDAYNDIAALAREGKKVLIRQDFKQLAYLMNENHRIQDSLCDSGEINKFMIKTALENGALAAKLAGAGGGGTIIVLTLNPKQTKLALEAVGAEEFIEFDPVSKGLSVEYIDKKNDFSYNCHSIIN